MSPLKVGGLVASERCCGMQLLKVCLEDFRRFAGRVCLDVDENLLALVGPNEAGKSSVLDAIEMLLTRTAPSERDRTWKSAGPTRISGDFRLNELDQGEIRDLYDGDDIREAWVTLTEAGEPFEWKLIPHPMRDLTPRRHARELVLKLTGDLALDEQYSTNPDELWIPELFNTVLDALGDESESLGEQSLGDFAALANRIRGLEYPPDQEPLSEEGEDDDAVPDARRAEVARLERNATARWDAAAALFDLLRIEREPEPSALVIRVLNNRLPSVVFFRDEHRQLSEEYVLAEVAADPPKALRNLCRVAELSLPELNDNWELHLGDVERLIEDGNQRLKERFTARWNQSTVYPKFVTPKDGRLRILIASEDGGRYTELWVRSDGLRWFLALDAFLFAEGADTPIVLVDEAETHLHYDAQADLIDALMHQDVTAKVIYTTHSVGCLPPDLGRGIRAVVRDGDSQHSTIANSYWSLPPGDSDRVGLAPLLFAMGASMLSFTVPRYALIVEGTSDAILLPTLFREVGDDDEPLDFRVVPGIAELAEGQMLTLGQHGGSVATLTDGDKDGVKYNEQIVAAGSIPSSRAFDLTRVAEGSILEDLVTLDVFIEALNTELHTWSLCPLVPDDWNPDTDRWTAIKRWFTQHDSDWKRLNKNRLAQRIVDISSGNAPGKHGTEKRAVVDPTVKAALAQLRSDIEEALRAPAPPSAS